MIRSLLLACMLALPSPASAQDLGEPAHALKAEHWFNWVGDGPTMEGLRGRTVLVHFFLVKEPEKNAFLTLCKFHEEYADKGLVILAVAPDAMGSVRRMLEDYPLPFPIGAGCRDKQRWDINAKRGQVLIDPRGNVYYRAEMANGVWNGKLLKALKGSKRLGERGALAYRPSEEYSKRWSSVIEDLAEGELAKALKNLERVLDNEKTSAADLGEGRRLADGVKEHIAHLSEQIDVELERGAVLLARGALEALAKELKRHPLGAPALARLAALEDDGDHAKELEAAETFASLVTAFFTRGLEKNRSKFEALIDNFAGTQGAAKAENWVNLVMTHKF